MASFCSAWNGSGLDAASANLPGASMLRTCASDEKVVGRIAGMSRNRFTACFFSEDCPLIPLLAGIGDLLGRPIRPRAADRVADYAARPGQTTLRMPKITKRSKRPSSRINDARDMLSFLIAFAGGLDGTSSASHLDDRVIES
jgi:hypothetical protein